MWRGLDASQLSTEDGCGTNPPFRASTTGERKDALLLLRSHGANTFRMRMWNDPCADGRCNTSEFSYASLTGVMQMARRSRSANLTFVLDLHFSDWWADPEHQSKPHAWASLPFDELARAVYEFSRGTVAALKEQGTTPAAVQVGNEISNGMLWESAGQGCELGGRLWCGGDSRASLGDDPRYGCLSLVGRLLSLSSSAVDFLTRLVGHVLGLGPNLGDFLAGCR